MDFNNSYLIIIFVLLVIALGVFTLMSFQIPVLNIFQQGIYNIVTPVNSFVVSVINGFNSYWSGFINANEIIEENKELKREVALLENEIRKLEESERQNQRLEKINEFLDVFKKFIDYEIKGASVIGHNPSNWENKMIINKGSNDGIKERMPVISYHGILVGQIENTAGNSAQVLMINNPDFVVGGLVQDTRTVGLVRGEVGCDERNIMEKIPEDGEIQPGDRILTSGLSSNFPKYLPIGEVLEVNVDQYGISQIAEIDLFINNYTIEEVVVITDY